MESADPVGEDTSGSTGLLAGEGQEQRFDGGSIEADWGSGDIRIATALPPAPRVGEPYPAGSGKRASTWMSENERKSGMMGSAPAARSK